VFGRGVMGVDVGCKIVRTGLDLGVGDEYRGEVPFVDRWVIIGGSEVGGG